MSDAYDLDAGPDPAQRAAAEPEPAIAAELEPATAEDAGRWPVTDGVEPVHAVGIGPGNTEYLTPRGRRVLHEADVVVGFETVLEYVEDVLGGDALSCGYRTEAATLERFAERVADGERGAAALMGDPNHSGYQFVGKVEAALASAAGDGSAVAPVAVLPGISSLQVAASRARTPMEATEFVTLHRSGSVDDSLDRLRETVGERHLLVLPRPFDWMPERIAATLLDAGAAPGLSALVLERLTHDSESVTSTTLGALAARGDGVADARSTEDALATADADDAWGRDQTRFSDLSVLAVRAD